MGRAPRETADDATAANGLVGREQELHQLRRIVDDACSGRGRLVLVTGEAGMGKSALAEELGVVARGRGSLVLWGSCWEAVDTRPYWAWSQVLRQVVAAIPPEELQAWPPSVVEAVHQLVPDLSRGSQDTPPKADRPSVFDGAWSALARLAAQQPTVVVLEDLHAADQSSLLLLQFMSKQVRALPLLLVGTYDEREARRRTAQAQLLAEIAQDAQRFDLNPLGEDSVAALYERTTGEKPTPAIAAAVARVSEGNPFFIQEAIRTLDAKGDLNRPDFSVGFRVPHGVRNVLRARIAALPENSIEILGVASVIGRRFDINLLGLVSELDADSLLELLEQPRAFDVIEESSVLGTYAFTHILIRETLYDDLTAAKRMRLHLRLAETLESLHEDDLDAVLPEMAHHWFKAGHVGDLKKTVHYTTLAARQAEAAQAHEESARLYHRALKAAESVAVDPTVAKDLKDSLARAQERSGAVDEAGSEAAVPSEVHSFLREGEYWTVTYRGLASRLRDTKGLRYIAHLLANPGREVHVLDLVQTAMGGAPPPSGERPADLTSGAFADAGEVLDARAKAEYKRRLDELREDLDEAETFNDVERAAKARAEIEALVQQLAAATGLGGRGRKVTTEAERARVNVSKTVKEAVRRLAAADPRLGDHLATTIRTGTFCAYKPDPRVPIRWRL